MPSPTTLPAGDQISGNTRGSYSGTDGGGGGSGDGDGAHFYYELAGGAPYVIEARNGFGRRALLSLIADGAAIGAV